MFVRIYVIKLYIYNVTCEINAYTQRISEGSTCSFVLLFAIIFFSCRHTHLRVWNVKVHCKIFLNIYGKLYVKQLFMFMNYLFHAHFFVTAIRLIVLSIISTMGLLYFSMI